MNLRIKDFLKRIHFVIITIILILMVLILLLTYRNGELIDLFSSFRTIDSYKNSIVLFYDNSCSHCIKVDMFITNNTVEQKIQLVRLETSSNSFNANLLVDKAQICGLEEESMGVPFLWDGENQTCIIGYVDIINFFKTRIK